MSPSPKGASFAAATDSLEAHGLVRWRPWFSLVARVGKYDRAIKPGIYEFTPGTSALAILRDLRDGKYLTIKVTIPEGFTVIDIAARLGDALRVAPDSVFAAVRGTPPCSAGYGRRGAEPSRATSLPRPTPCPRTTRPVRSVDAMRRSSGPGWDPTTWQPGPRPPGLTRHQVLALASIVEGEARWTTNGP